MTNNDILRRLRYTIDYTDLQMMAVFDLADHEIGRDTLGQWLKKEDEPEFQPMSDQDLAIFLNGLINQKRGKREGPQPVPETELDNNAILRKLKIAFNLKDTDILDIFAAADTKLSKHEISAFFRSPSQTQYRPCLDQYLRNFLQGLQKRLRG
jgi:uncharacterized protein YehS (DUF1456 family)